MIPSLPTGGIAVVIGRREERTVLEQRGWDDHPEWLRRNRSHAQDGVSSDGRDRATFPSDGHSGVRRVHEGMGMPSNSKSKWSHLVVRGLANHLQHRSSAFGLRARPSFNFPARFASGLTILLFIALEKHRVNRAIYIYIDKRRAPLRKKIN